MVEVPTPNANEGNRRTRDVQEERARRMWACMQTGGAGDPVGDEGDLSGWGREREASPTFGMPLLFCSR